MPPPGLRVAARWAFSPRAIHVLSPDLVTIDKFMIIPLRVAQRAGFETETVKPIRGAAHTKGVQALADTANSLITRSEFLCEIRPQSDTKRFDSVC